VSAGPLTAVWGGALGSYPTTSLSCPSGVCTITTAAPSSEGYHTLTLALGGTVLSSLSVPVVPQVAAETSTVTATTLSDTLFSLAVTPSDLCGTYMGGLSPIGVVRNTSGAVVGQVTFSEVGLASEYYSSVSVSGEGVYDVTVSIGEVVLSTSAYASGCVSEVDGVTYYPSALETLAAMSVPSHIDIGSPFSVVFSLLDVAGDIITAQLSMTLEWQGVTYSSQDYVFDGSAYHLSLTAPLSLSDSGTHYVSIFLDGSATSFVSVPLDAAVELGSSWVYGCSQLTPFESDGVFGTCLPMEYSFSLLDKDSAPIEEDLPDASIDGAWSGPLAQYPSVTVSYMGDGEYVLAGISPSDAGTHTLSVSVGSLWFQSTTVTLEQLVSADECTILIPQYVLTGDTFTVDVTVRDGCGTLIPGLSPVISVLDSYSDPVDGSLYPLELADPSAGVYSHTVTAALGEGVYTVRAVQGDAVWEGTTMVAAMVVSDGDRYYSVSAIHSSVVYTNHTHRGEAYSATITLREVSGALVPVPLTVTGGYGDADTPALWTGDVSCTYTIEGVVPCSEYTPTHHIRVDGVSVLSDAVSLVSVVSAAESTLRLSDSSTSLLHSVVGDSVTITLNPSDSCGDDMGASDVDPSAVSIGVEADGLVPQTLSLGIVDGSLSCEFTPTIEGVYSVYGELEGDTFGQSTLYANTLSVSQNGVVSYISKDASTLSGVPPLVGLGDSLPLSLSLCDMAGGQVSGEGVPVSVSWTGSDTGVTITPSDSSFEVDVSVPADMSLVGSHLLSVSVADTPILHTSLSLAARAAGAAGSDPVWVGSVAVDMETKVQTCGSLHSSVSVYGTTGSAVTADVSAAVYSVWSSSDDVYEYTFSGNGACESALDSPDTAGVYTVTTYLQDSLSASEGSAVSVGSNTVSVHQAISLSNSGVDVTSAATQSEPFTLGVTVCDACQTPMPGAVVTYRVTDVATGQIVELNGLTMGEGGYSGDLSLPSGQYDLRTTVTEGSVHFAVITDLTVSDPSSVPKVLLGLGLGVLVFTVGVGLSWAIRHYRQDRPSRVKQARTLPELRKYMDRGDPIPTPAPSSKRPLRPRVRGTVSPSKSQRNIHPSLAAALTTNRSHAPVGRNKSAVPGLGVKPVSLGDLTKRGHAQGLVARPPQARASLGPVTSGAVTQLQSTPPVGHLPAFTLPAIPTNGFAPLPVQSMHAKMVPIMAPIGRAAVPSPPTHDPHRLSFSEVMPGAARRASISSRGSLSRRNSELPAFELRPSAHYSDSEPSDAEF
ncbi:hypothetical protein KIPB_003578, partial [Kipferlia bialata]